MLFKYIGLAVNTGKAKYMEIGCRRGLIANEHIRIGSHSYEKVKTFKSVFRLFSDIPKFCSGGYKM